MFTAMHIMPYFRELINILRLLCHRTRTAVLHQGRNGIFYRKNNRGICVVPQILTNRSDYFLRTMKELAAFGYQEVNLNLGCPSGTVVSKGKGAGFLEDADKLELFLTRCFKKRI